MTEKTLRKILEEKDIEKTLKILLDIINGNVNPYDDIALESDIFERFITRHSYSENTVKSYRGKFLMFLDWAHAKNLKTVSEITKDIAEEYIRKCYGEKFSGNYDIMVLSKIWSELFPKIVDNPWKQKFGLRTRERKRMLTHRILSKRECVKIENELKSSIDENEGNVEFNREFLQCLEFAKTYGMRMSSIASLKMSDFKSYKSRRMFLHVPPKTRKSKPFPLEIPITENIREILDKRYDRNSEYLFPLFHERYSRGTSLISHYFKRIVKKCRIKDTMLGISSFHCFRTNFITHMDELKCPSSITDSITGHASQSMHSLYSRPCLRVKRKWLEKLCKYQKHRKQIKGKGYGEQDYCGLIGEDFIGRYRRIGSFKFNGNGDK